MRLFLTVVVAFLLLLGGATDSARGEPALPTIPLNEVETFYNVSRAKSGEARFITEADVIAVMGNRAVLSDETMSIYTLNPPNAPDANWKAGERIRATCVVKANPCLPDEWAVTVLSHEDLYSVPAPDPAVLEVNDLNAGLADMREVITEGVITDVFRDRTNPLYIYLMLSSGEDDITLTIQDGSDEAFKSAFKLIDAAVRVKGLCVLGSNGAHRFIGRSIDLNSQADITVLQAGSSATLKPLPSTSRFPLMRQRQFPHRLSARGTLIAAWSPYHALFRTDDGRCLRLHLTLKGKMPAPGTRIEARGFLRVNTFFAGLYNVTCRKIDPLNQPEEEPLTLSPRKLIYDALGRSCINPSLDGRLLTFEGLVLDSLSTTPREARCVIEQDGVRIVVQLGDLEVPRTGSKIRVTGACRVTFEEYGKYLTRPVGIELITRRAEDIILLADPPYWTVPRLKYTLLFSALGIAALFLCCLYLRHLVERRGRALAQKELKLAAANLKSEERVRLAVELHDSIAQSILAVSLQLDTASLIAEKDPAAAKRQLELASRMLKACLKEIRACIWDLHNQTFEFADLNEAIISTVTPVMLGGDLHCAVKVPREKLTENLTHTILRILRELASNGVRHGKAKNVTIEGELTDDKLSFTVVDDGEGFDPETAPSSNEGHFGVQGIRERLRHYKGHLTLTSAKGKGTRAEIELILPKHSQIN